MKLFQRTVLVALLCLSAIAQADPIRVVVWDERQKKQQQAYDGFLGDTIAAHLEQDAALAVRSVGQDDFNDLAKLTELLSDCDVLIWWGHVRHGELGPDIGELVVNRVRNGMGFIGIHSAHWATPFIALMTERAKQDAMRTYAAPGDRVKVNVLSPPWTMTQKIQAISEKAAVGRPHTPYAEVKKSIDGLVELTLHPPICVFPIVRDTGEPSYLRTLAPAHPIAEGIPANFQIPATEIYGEPFHIPAPDTVVFEERWSDGSWFRGGACWDLDEGKVFYFRPGHETYAVFKQPLPLKIIANAVKWAGG